MRARPSSSRWHRGVESSALPTEKQVLVEQGSRGRTVAKRVRGGHSVKTHALFWLQDTPRTSWFGWGSPGQDTPDTFLWNPLDGSTLHWRTLVESGARYAEGQDVASTLAWTSATTSTPSPSAEPLASVTTSRSQRSSS